MPKVPRVLAITSGRTTLHWLDELIADGVDALQVREKHLMDGDLLRLVTNLVEHAAGRLAIWVNGRADVAAAARAEGVHLPARGVPTHAVRKSFPSLGVGRSTHHVDEIRAATLDGAHYVTFGPVRPTPSKARFGPAQGFDALHAATLAAGSMPVVALGGLRAEDFEPVLQAGARGFAGIRVFSDPQSRRRLVAAAADAWGKP